MMIFVLILILFISFYLFLHFLLCLVSFTGRRFELRKTFFRVSQGSSSLPCVTTSGSSPPPPCDNNEDQYSSEEELKEIISENKKSALHRSPEDLVGEANSCLSSSSSSANSGAAAEKRKWCEMEASDDSESETQSPAFVIRPVSSGSSEDDKYTLGVTTPVQFRTSPPLDVHRPRQSQSPPPKFFHLSSATSDESGISPDISSSSGDMSKRHRRRHSGDSRHHSPSKRHRSTTRPHNIQRPCLDFEKMQQIKKRVVTSWRPKGTELSLFCW
eukprot:TRINITY_DN3146_c0_g1_i2.p1 TRINITY_DN3146_c0_g1~~TRINITY_DN3146_c0_g1_i2.p1  ORF type:complete len:272 (-),score=46.57 TRINITY_DN3146_c0_g1_i2:1870-2685(-)